MFQRFNIYAHGTGLIFPVLGTHSPRPSDVLVPRSVAALVATRQYQRIAGRLVLLVVCALRCCSKRFAQPLASSVQLRLGISDRTPKNSCNLLVLVAFDIM